VPSEEGDGTFGQEEVIQGISNNHVKGDSSFGKYFDVRLRRKDLPTTEKIFKRKKKGVLSKRRQSEHRQGGEKRGGKYL